MAMTTGKGLWNWGSTPGQGKSLTLGFVLKYSSNMMVTPVRIYGCADHI